MKSNCGYHRYCRFCLTLCVIYGLGMGNTCHGYSVCGYGYGVGKPDPQVTHFKPYSLLPSAHQNCVLFLGAIGQLVKEVEEQDTEESLCIL